MVKRRSKIIGYIPKQGTRSITKENIEDQWINKLQQTINTLDKIDNNINRLINYLNERE